MKTKSQREIEKFIDKMSTRYIGTRFRYELIEPDNTHLIEVIPLSTFKNNLEYGIDEFDFTVMFQEKYGETVMFISEDSLIKIQNPIYVCHINEPEFIFADETIREKPIIDRIRDLFNEEGNVFSLFNVNSNLSDFKTVNTDSINMEIN